MREETGTPWDMKSGWSVRLIRMLKDASIFKQNQYHMPTKKIIISSYKKKIGKENANLAPFLFKA